MKRLSKLTIYMVGEKRPVWDTIHLHVYVDPKGGSYVNWYFRKTSYTLGLNGWKRINRELAEKEAREASR